MIGLIMGLKFAAFLPWLMVLPLFAAQSAHATCIKVDQNSLAVTCSNDISDQRNVIGYRTGAADPLEQITASNIAPGASIMGTFINQGAATARTRDQHNTREIDMHGIIGGIYRVKNHGSWQSRLTAVGGWFSQDQKHTIISNQAFTGLETGKPDFGAWYFAPSLSLQAALVRASWLSDNLNHSVLASLRLNYATLMADNYSEIGSTYTTGTADPFSHDLSATAEFTLPLLANTNGEGDRKRLGLRLGASGQTTIDTTNHSVGLRAENLSVGLDRHQQVIGLAGVDFTMESAAGDKAVKATFESSSNFQGSDTYSGSLSIRFLF